VPTPEPALRAQRRRAAGTAVIAVALLAALGALHHRSQAVHPPAAATPAESSPASPRVDPPTAPVPSSTASGLAPSAASDESLATVRLRALEGSDPAAALALARDLDTRFPDSQDAPERAAIAVQSLGRLGRFAEARREAQALVRRYPGTPWAAKVVTLAEAAREAP